MAFLGECEQRGWYLLGVVLLVGLSRCGLLCLLGLLLLTKHEVSDGVHLEVQERVVLGRARIEEPVNGNLFQ